MKLSLLAHLPIDGQVADVMLCGSANRVLVVRDGKPALILDATTGKEIGKLPKDAQVATVDAAGTIAAVVAGGKTVAGRYEWQMWLWDLTTGKKIAVLATNHPDDNLAPAAIGRTRVVAVRKKKKAYSVVLFDRTGKKVAEHALGKVPLSFLAALSADERLVAHAYFTGGSGLVDAATGKARKLAGGALKTGRDHDKGVSELSFDASGEHLLAVSHGSESAHVWSTQTGKSVSGSWIGKPMQDAFFVGDSLVLASSGSREGTAVVHSLVKKAKPRAIVVGKASMLFANAGDDRILARAGHTGWDAFAESGLELYDLVSGKRAAKAVLPKRMAAVSWLAASPGRVAVGDRKGGVALYAYA
jgi:hypothetical protein